MSELIHHSTFAPSVLSKPITYGHAILDSFYTFDLFLCLHLQFTHRGLAIDATNPVDDVTRTFKSAMIDINGDLCLVGESEDGTFAPSPYLVMNESDVPEHYGVADPEREYYILDPIQRDTVVAAITETDDVITDLLLDKYRDLTGKEAHELVVRRKEFINPNDSVTLGVVVSDVGHRIDVLRVLDLSGDRFAITNHHKLEWEIIPTAE